MRVRGSALKSAKSATIAGSLARILVSLRLRVLVGKCDVDHMHRLLLNSSLLVKF